MLGACGSRLEPVKKGACGLDRKVIGEREQMLVAGDKDGSLAFGEGKQVVVPGVCGMVRGSRRIGCEDRAVAKQRDVVRCLTRRDPRAELGVGERPLEFREQRFRDDELEVAGEPARDELSGRAARREEGGDEDVRVEDDAHSAPTSPRLVLGLDGERCGLLFAHVVAVPQPLEQVEAELTPQRCLDHRAVAFAGARPADLHGAQDVLVDREGRVGAGN